MEVDGSRVALITGGSRGIGRAIALKLASEGIRVAINYRGNQSAAQQVGQAIEQLGGEFLLCPGDVSSVAESQHLVDQVLDHWHRIDILVNNAQVRLVRH